MIDTSGSRYFFSILSTDNCKHPLGCDGARTCVIYRMSTCVRNPVQPLPMLKTEIGRLRQLVKLRIHLLTRTLAKRYA